MCRGPNPNLLILQLSVHFIPRHALHQLPSMMQWFTQSLRAPSPLAMVGLLSHPHLVYSDLKAVVKHYLNRGSKVCACLINIINMVCVVYEIAQEREPLACYFHLLQDCTH